MELGGFKEVEEVQVALYQWTILKFLQQRILLCQQMEETVKVQAVVVELGFGTKAGNLTKLLITRIYQ